MRTAASEREHQQPPDRDFPKTHWRQALYPILLLSACVGKQPSLTGAQLPPEALEVSQVVALISPSVPQREGWAQDILEAFHAHGIPTDRERVCAVIAVIQQESGFQANPPVPDLAGIVARRLETEAERLGPLGRPALHALLEGTAKGRKESFETRLKHVRTEADVDRIFRELLAFQKEGHPLAYATANLMDQLFRSAKLEDLNPVTTAGSMQVSVHFAVALPPHGPKQEPDQVRDSLYTRYGGVYYGVARLWGYEASYPKTLFRFADYNAGVYASRNAALQAELSHLTGTPLTPDGDLLAYDRHERPLPKDTESLKAIIAFAAQYAPELSEAKVRADVQHEKEHAFELTETYLAVRSVYERETGTKAADAQLPDVVIQSPKMKRDRSTRWYAEAVDRHLGQCLAKLK